MTTPQLEIDALQPWIEVRYDTASGPGGQNVNKVATRATLLFDFAACPALTPDQVARLRQRLASRLSRDGRLRIVAQQGRSQTANRSAADERLIAILTQALHVPRTRTPTRPTAGSRRRRLAAKRERGARKADRGNRAGHGDE